MGWGGNPGWWDDGVGYPLTLTASLPLVGSTMCGANSPSGLQETPPT